MKIGVIGIGRMGRPIADSLLKAGHSVAVYNRTPARAEELRSMGATVTTSVGEACQADIILTILADDAAVEAPVFRSKEFLPCFSENRVHVSMGTISIGMSRKLTETHAREGGRFVSAPVFGRPESAAAASLLILAAGPTEVISRISSIFAAIGKKVFIVGEEPYQANVLKLCGNFLLLSAIEALAESVAFAREQQISPRLLLDIMTDTLFTSPFYKAYGSLMVNEVFNPAGFKLQLGLKDAELLLEEAVRTGLPMPSASTLRDQLRMAVEADLGNYDVASLALFSRDRARVRSV